MINDHSVILNSFQNLVVSSSFKSWRSRNKFGMTIVGLPARLKYPPLLTKEGIGEVLIRLPKPLLHPPLTKGRQGGVILSLLRRGKVGSSHLTKER
jgi:hypothetical protein